MRAQRGGQFGTAACEALLAEIELCLMGWVLLCKVALMRLSPISWRSSSLAFEGRRLAVSSSLADCSLSRCCVVAEAADR